MRLKSKKFVHTLVIGVAIFLCAAIFGPRIITWSIVRTTSSVIHKPTDLPHLKENQHLAALVLGAGVINKRPSKLLDERIKKAVKLLKDGRVDVLIMSGDNSTEYYDEPTAMRKRAIELGAPSTQVAADYAGRRTWDSCRRAVDIFGLKKAVVVTTSFHVDRAVVTCRAAGIDTKGYSVSDNTHPLKRRFMWRLRELAATGRALVDAWIVRPAPAVGGPSINPWDPCEIRKSLAPSDAEHSLKKENISCE